MKKATQILMGSALVGFLIALPGCTHNLKYQPKQLQSLHKATAKQSETLEQTTVHFKQLSLVECKYYFNQERLVGKPIQVSVVNNSDHSWILSADNITLPLLNPTKIERKLHAGIVKSLVMGIVIPVVGLVHGVFSYQANNRISNDIKEKGLYIDQVIQPGEQLDVILFVHRKVVRNRDFSITLVNADDKDHKARFYFTI